MITGIGVDVVDVPDFAKRLERSNLLKLFSDAERDYGDSNPKRRVEILAARWAAKEAFGKALGTGLLMQWPKDEIEVVHLEQGRPALHLGPGVAHLLPPGAKAHLSITHTPAQAIAFVVIEAA